MDEPNAAVKAHLDKVTPEKRRRDAQTLLELMNRVTAESARLWRGVIGFGQYHYKYESGREGDAPAAGFAARKAATTIYLPDGIGRYEKQPRAAGVPHDRRRMPLYQGSRQDRLVRPGRHRDRVVPNHDSGHLRSSGSGSSWSASHGVMG